jgi:hypothetical protein
VQPAGLSLSLSWTTMIMLSSLLPLALALFPQTGAASIDGKPKIHSLPLKKLKTPNYSPASVLADKSYEVASLARKYGAQIQAPFLPDGHQNSLVDQSRSQDDGLFWTQEMKAGGGHNIPLESGYTFDALKPIMVRSTCYNRFHGCSVLHRNFDW